MKRKADQVFLFPNGMVAVCDSEGHQIPELQGFFLEAIPKLVGRVDRKTKFNLSVLSGIVDTSWYFDRKERKKQ